MLTVLTGRQDRLPGRALTGGPAAELSLDPAIQGPQLNSAARSQTLTNVSQTMHGPCLNTLNVFQCLSERTLYLCCCLPGPSATRPSTPHLSTCFSHQLQSCAGHTCHSLCLEHSSQRHLLQASGQSHLPIQMRSPPCYSLSLSPLFFVSTIFITIRNYIFICLMCASHLKL